jgi:non-ribosomal peptide synthetase component F
MNDIAPPSLPQAHPDILHGPQRAELLREEILADLLEASARRAPGQTALVSGERRVSYAELDRQADLVAARLIAAGVGPGQIVGLWLPRGVELLLLQAGVAKAGAAWLPVDEDTPVERLQICSAAPPWRRAWPPSAARCGPPRPCWRRPRRASRWRAVAPSRPTSRPT